MNTEPSSPPDKQSFWTTLPGIFAQLAVLIGAITALLALLLPHCSSRGNAPSWEHKSIHVGKGIDNKDVKSGIEDFINSVGKPDDLYDVKAFISQIGRMADYDIHLFCKTGSGKVQVVAECEQWINDESFKNSLRGRSVVLLGMYHGEAHECVWLVRKVGDESSK